MTSPSWHKPEISRTFRAPLCVRYKKKAVTLTSCVDTSQHADTRPLSSSSMLMFVINDLIVVKSVFTWFFSVHVHEFHPSSFSSKSVLVVKAIRKTITKTKDNHGFFLLLSLALALFVNYTRSTYLSWLPRRLHHHRLPPRRTPTLLTASRPELGLRRLQLHYRLLPMPFVVFANLTRFRRMPFQAFNRTTKIKLDKSTIDQPQTDLQRFRHRL